MTFLAAMGLVCAAAAQAQLIPEVRAAINADDFKKAEAIVASYRKAKGETAELIEAHSWLGRGALARKRFAVADQYAEQTRRLAIGALKGRTLDAEDHLPIALGAAIEVHGQALAGMGQRSEAISYLKSELQTWKQTSIRTRIQKNINLLSLEGTLPPGLLADEWIGEKPPTLASLKGKAVLLFFWAHWCPDCKAQAPILLELQKTYGGKGLVIVGPTQRYGYAARGEDATPAQEKKYIEQLRKQFFGGLQMAVPLSEENFKLWGASSTPTLVLLDRRGVVRMYHPGQMTMAELRPKVEEALR